MAEVTNSIGCISIPPVFLNTYAAGLMVIPFSNKFFGDCQEGFIFFKGQKYPEAGTIWKEIKGSFDPFPDPSKMGAFRLL